MLAPELLKRKSIFYFFELGRIHNMADGDGGGSGAGSFVWALALIIIVAIIAAVIMSTGNFLHTDKKVDIEIKTPTR